MKKTAYIMISNRHVHLNRESCDKLFGEGYELTVKRNMGFPIFAANEAVTLIGPKGKIENVRVLGPLRSYTQAEVLRADCFKLGVDAPIRLSGSKDIAPIKLLGPAGELPLEHGVMIAMRHIHISPDKAKEYNLKDRQVVNVKIGGERSLIFEKVAIVYTEIDDPTMHVDVEEGNAANVTNMDVVEILE